MDIQQEADERGPVTPVLRGRLEPADVADELLAASVGPDSAAIALWTSSTAAEARPVPARVTRHNPGLISVVEIPELDVAYPKVQPLPGGRTLVVGARCRWRPEGAERNAVIFDADGRKSAEGTLGDGIQEVLTTPTGRIWVGYFDEGVYGNYGWGGPGPEPVGSPGLVQFTDAFEVAWQYPDDADGGDISDAYSLNVEGEIAHVCYYADFPLVCIDADVLQTWKNTAVSPQAIAVSDTRCAMFGGYGGDANRLLFGRLTPGGFQPTHRATVTLPTQAGLPRLRPHVVGRGATLHFFAGLDWYSLSLDQYSGI